MPNTISRPSSSRSRTVSSRVTRSLAALLTLLTVVGSTAGSPVDAAEIREIVLPVPVESVGDVYWSDTFGAPRSGGRSHEGVDMLGPKMTPLIAAADGYVSWMRHDTLRGNNLVITDADGWKYHYIHINNDTPGTDDGANAFEHAFAPGIERGAQVTAGQVVAYMGDSGNAESCCSHLHFEIETPDGRALNPTASVDDALARALAGSQPSSSQQAFIDDVYEVLQGAEPTSVESGQLLSTIEDEGVAAALAPFVDEDSRAASIDRLYFAVFDRVPDAGGFEFWINELANGRAIADVSNHFANSDEYEARYGAGTDEDLLVIMYDQLFDRAPDPGGRDYWLERLANDDQVNRGTVLSFFTEGIEAKVVAGARSEMVALNALFNEGAMPTPAELAEWETVRASNSLEEAIASEFLADESVQALYAGLLD